MVAGAAAVGGGVRRSVAAVAAAYADAAPAGGDPAENAAYVRRRDAIAREWTAARTLSGQAQRVAGFLLVAGWSWWSPAPSAS